MSFPPGENEARERFGADFDALHIDSKLTVSKAKPLKNVDPVIVPIYHSTTYRFNTVAQWDEPNHGSNYVYSRCGNPTVENAEVIISEMEGAAATLLYNSGLAAVSAVLLEFLSAGDHVVCMTPLYSGSFSFMVETLTRFGVTFSFIDVEKEANFAEAVRSAITDKTKLIYLEVIANPSMAVPDILGVLELKKSHESAVDAALVSRGLKTLALRMDKISANAATVAQHLASHSKVVQTFYPGLECHPQHEAAAKLFPHGRFSGMIAFDVGTAEKAQKLAESVRLITLAVSLGGTESLLEHPFSMSHGKQLLRDEQHGSMVSPGLLRFSIGVEDASDLIADLDRALALI